MRYLYNEKMDEDKMDEGRGNRMFEGDKKLQASTSASFKKGTTINVCR